MFYPLVWQGNTPSGNCIPGEPFGPGDPEATAITAEEILREQAEDPYCKELAKLVGTPGSHFESSSFDEPPQMG